MSAVVVIGVDPGARATGIVVRAGQELLAHTVVERPADGDLPGGVTPAYLADVAAQARAYVATHRAAVVAVENVVEPNPHVNRRRGSAVINVAGILGAAVVLGHLHATFPGLVLVRPARNGSQLLAAYPAELVTAAERRQGLNRPAGDSAVIRHARSAWDVAGTGALAHRLDTATRAGMHASPTA